MRRYKALIKPDYFKLILLFGAILRFALLLSGKQIVDPEVATLNDSIQTSIKDLVTGNYGYFTFHNFLYYLFLKGWTYFSTDSLWLRLPSLIFSILEIILLYKILLAIFNSKIEN